jgi:hypothetical protein
MSGTLAVVGLKSHTTAYHHGKGLNICVDNWYVTRETVEYLLKLKFNFVGTIQRTRLGPFFGKGCIPDIFFHKPSKKDFQRRMYVLRVVLETTAIDLISYFDKPNKYSCNFITNCQNQLLDYTNLPHHSQILVGKTKPAIVLLYNDRMGTVDSCDFCLNKWSISFRAQNRKNSWSHFAKRRLTNMLDIYILDLYLIVKNDMKKRGLKITNSCRQDFQLKLAFDFFEKKVILPPLPCPSPIREIRRQMTLSTLSSPKLVVSGKNDIPKKCDLCPSQKQGGKRSKYTCAFCERTACVQHRRPYMTSFLCKICAPFDPVEPVEITELPNN